MKRISVYILIGFFGLQLFACGDDDDPPTTPDISIIEGVYKTDIQHDIISVVSGVEIYDSSYVEDFASTSVTLDGDLVSFSFPKGGRLELPDLTYEVSSVEESEFYGFTDVYLTLTTTDQYRMKSSSNQVVFPIFRILDDNPRNTYKVDLTLFLRSQDSDSVYNIWVTGSK